MRAQQRELRGLVRRVDGAGHRRVQRVDARERPRGQHPLRDPGRMLEDAAKQRDERGRGQRIELVEGQASRSSCAARGGRAGNGCVARQWRAMSMRRANQTSEWLRA